MTRTVGESGLSLWSVLGLLVLAVCCLAGLMDFMDGVITNVALPSIQRSFGFSQQQLSWVASGYLLSYGCLMLPGGRAADVYGRRRMFATGTLVFFGASLIAGGALNGAMLIGGRVLQGVGAALTMPAVLSLVNTSFKEGRGRKRALGIWGALFGVATAIGFVAGGVITENWGWRWVLLINPFICMVILGGIFVVLPRDRPSGQKVPFDVAGAAFVTAGLGLLVWGFVDAPQAGWWAPSTILRFVGALAALIAFVLIESHRESRGTAPLMPLSIFRERGVVAANLTQLIAIGGLMGMFYVLTLYMQNVLGWSASQTGWAYLPATGGVGIGAGVATTVGIRWAGTKWVIVAGAVLAAVGVHLLADLHVHSDYRHLLPGVLVFSGGLGMVFVAVLDASTAGVPPALAGIASGLFNSCTQLGAMFGVAVASTVSFSRINDLLARGTATAEAMTAGFSHALHVSSIVIAAAAVIGLFTTNTRRRTPSPVATL